MPSEVGLILPSFRRQYRIRFNLWSNCITGMPQRYHVCAFGCFFIEITSTFTIPVRISRIASLFKIIKLHIRILIVQRHHDSSHCCRSIYSTRISLSLHLTGRVECLHPAQAQWFGSNQLMIDSNGCEFTEECVNERIRVK